MAQTDLPPPVARFEFTIDELVEVGERTLSRSRVVAGLRRNAAVGFALVAALLVFLAAPGGTVVRLGAALLVAALAGIGYGPLRRKLVAARLHAYWHERLQGEARLTCEVELTPHDIVVRQLSSVTTLPWAQVAAVAESEGGVEIVGRRRGVVLVRERAFATAADKRRFVDYARARQLG